MTVLTPPSARLPPIRSIHEHSVEVLGSLVEYLRTIYNPPVRGTRRVNRKVKHHFVKHAGGPEDVEAQAELRADEFERAYAVRWLTALVAQASLLQDPSMEGEKQDGRDFEEKVDELVQRTASLLAVCAGSAAAGTITRRFPFRSPLLDSPFEVQLTDIPISVDGDEPTVGAHTWGGACLLAEMILESPGRFGLSDDAVARGPRILELGAGTGLVSLAISSYLSARSAQTHVNFAATAVIASDYHPAVLENLSRNISLNASANLVLPSVHALDWSEFSPAFGSCPPSVVPFDRPFDLIFGADIVYEPEHAHWIRDTVAALLRRPGGTEGSPSPRFHLLIPLRHTHASESRTVEELFPHATPDTLAPSASAEAGHAQKLCILEQDAIVCEAGDARPGVEVEYVHYVIGWV